MNASGKTVVVRRRIRGNYGKWLVIPDTAKEKPQQGEVLAVGPGNDPNRRVN